MHKPILFINACVRRDTRTLRLAAPLLLKLGKPFKEIDLAEMSFPVTNEAFLQKRDCLLFTKDYSDPMFAMARDFAEAEEIVIAAPYWDLSFPATLKQYLEQVNVVGITFKYTEEGIPVGLCKAKRIFYVTTAGGFFVPHEYGFGYVKALAENYYGIHDVRLLEAKGLDIVGADVDAILEEAEGEIEAITKKD